METYQDIKSATHIDAIIRYVETLLGIRFDNVKKNRYSAPCPFHADIKADFMAYVDKKKVVRFHCFGACNGDWDVYDLIMLRKNYRFLKARQIWAEHLGVEAFEPCDGDSSRIPEPEDTPEPDDTVAFVEPKKLDEKIVAALDDAAGFYHGLLLSNEDRFKDIREYLARRGVGKDAVQKFNIGYAPPYDDAQYRGKALIDGFSPRFENDFGIFDAFSDGGLIRFLNDRTVKKYGYYRRQIDFGRKYPFSRNYGDYLEGRIVFPIYDADAHPVGIVGRRPGERGVRCLKQRSREIALSSNGWLYGIEKALPYIRRYRTILLTGGVFDYFAFYNLLHGQEKTVVVSTLGSYIAPEAANFLQELEIVNFIVAYDWDELGRNGIERIAFKSGGWVYYLGGLAEGRDPCDMLKPVADAISGFSLKPPKI